MRRIVVVALLLALCGCAAPAENGGESAVPFPTPELAAVTAAQAAQAVVDSQGDLVGLTPLEEEDQDFYLAELYGLEEDLWTDAAVYAAPGVDAREVAVIRLSGMDAVESVRTALLRVRRNPPLRSPRRKRRRSRRKHPARRRRRSPRPRQHLFQRLNLRPRLRRWTRRLIPAWISAALSRLTRPMSLI